MRVVYNELANRFGFAKFSRETLTLQRHPNISNWTFDRINSLANVSFLIVRDPLPRLLSSWQDKMVETVETVDKKCRQIFPPGICGVRLGFY